MEIVEYYKADKFESTNWYYRSRKDLFIQLLRKNLEHKNAKILDVGCGTGTISQELKQFGTVVSFDFSETALAICKKKEIMTIRATSEVLPFKDNSLDVVALFGVIEHAKEDDKALAEAKRVCKPNGLIIFECPAFQFLWSKHDVASHHYRRYTTKSLRNKLENLNLKIKKLSYIYTLIFPAVLLLRLFRKRATGKNASDPFEKFPKIVNELMLEIHKFERALLQFADMPFGVSIVGLVQKWT